MSISKTRLIACAAAAVALAAAACSDAQQSADTAKITGFAFVDSSVTGRGSRAQLPPGAKIFPPGARVTGTEGCPTTEFRTDGLIVAVIDYTGRPTAGSVTISTVPQPQFGQRPPYYLDLNAGQTLQFLGPVFENGTYEVKLDYFFGQAQQKSDTAQFTLERQCP